MNLYGYAGGDPVNFSDPFGLSPCCLLGGADAIVQEAIRVTKIEHEAMLEYAGQRAASNTMLIMGGLEAGWSVLRAGVGIARNLPQASNVTEQVAFKSLFSGAGRELAGGASGVTFRDAGRIASTYGGRAADWAKMSSAARWTDRMGRQFETHWVENIHTGVKVEAKFKLVKDVR